MSSTPAGFGRNPIYRFRFSPSKNEEIYIETAYRHFIKKERFATIARDEKITRQAAAQRVRTVRKQLLPLAENLIEQATPRLYANGYADINLSFARNQYDNRSISRKAVSVLHRLIEEAAEKAGIRANGYHLYTKEWEDRHMEKIKKEATKNGLPLPLSGSARRIASSDRHGVVVKGGKVVQIRMSDHRVKNDFLNFVLYAQRYGKPFTLDQAARIFPAELVPAGWKFRKFREKLFVTIDRKGTYMHLLPFLAEMWKTADGQKLVNRAISAGRFFRGNTIEMDFDTLYGKIIKESENIPKLFTVEAAMTLAQMVSKLEIRMNLRIARIPETERKNRESSVEKSTEGEKDAGAVKTAKPRRKPRRAVQTRKRRKKTKED